MQLKVNVISDDAQSHEGGRRNVCLYAELKNIGRRGFNSAKQTNLALHCWTCFNLKKRAYLISRQKFADR